MATKKAFPLRLGSRGLKVRDIQWLLGGNNKLDIDTYDGRIDRKFGRRTAEAVKRAKYQLGYKKPINGVAGRDLYDYLTGNKALPADYRERRKDRIVPKTAVQLPLRVPIGPGGDFSYVDAEGAPDNRGTRHHAAHDWFAPGGTSIYSPVTGTVVESRPSSGSSGQVFGGTVKVQAPSGKVFVFRHTNPTVSEGRKVKAGDKIATVARWDDGPDHTHHEIWQTLAGGYDYENMIDPVPFYNKYARGK